MAALASGIVYAGLCLIAVKIFCSTRRRAALAIRTRLPRAYSAGRQARGSSVSPARSWSASVCYQGYRGLSKDFLHDSKTEEMKPAERRWITRTRRLRAPGPNGRFRFGRRLPDQGCASTTTRAAAIGLDGALAKIVNASYGPWLLGIVACGLIAFALYSVSDARYRRI